MLSTNRCRNVAGGNEVGDRTFGRDFTTLGTTVVYPVGMNLPLFASLALREHQVSPILPDLSCISAFAPSLFTHFRPSRRRCFCVVRTYSTVLAFNLSSMTPGQKTPRGQSRTLRKVVGAKGGCITSYPLHHLVRGRSQRDQDIHNHHHHHNDDNEHSSDRTVTSPQ